MSYAFLFEYWLLVFGLNLAIPREAEFYLERLLRADPTLGDYL